MYVLQLNSFQEIFEDNNSELVLTHNCTSVFLQQLSTNRCWENVKEIQWSCQPLQVGSCNQ